MDSLVVLTRGFANAAPNSADLSSTPLAPFDITQPYDSHLNFLERVRTEERFTLDSSESSQPIRFSSQPDYRDPNWFRWLDGFAEPARARDILVGIMTQNFEGDSAEVFIAELKTINVNWFSFKIFCFKVIRSTTTWSEWWFNNFSTTKLVFEAVRYRGDYMLTL